MHTYEATEHDTEHHNRASHQTRISFRSQGKIELQAVRGLVAPRRYWLLGRLQDLPSNCYLPCVYMSVYVWGKGIDESDLLKATCTCSLLLWPAEE